MIPWKLFRNAQDAYDWTHVNVKAFNYGQEITPETQLYVGPRSWHLSGPNFYTDFTPTELSAYGGLGVLRLFVGPNAPARDRCF